MTLGNVVSGSIWAAFIGFIIFAVANGSKQEAAEKIKKIADEENRKLRENEAERQELEFISTADALFPDAEAALAKLKTRYTWAEIANSAGLHRKLRRAAREFICSETVTLPNMKIAPLGKPELQAIREAKRGATELDLSLAPILEEIYDGFTVQTLAAVESLGFIVASPKPDTKTRTFKIAATAEGDRFLSIERKFQDQNDGLARPTCGPETAATRKAVAKVFRKAVFGLAPSAAS